MSNFARGLADLVKADDAENGITPEDSHMLYQTFLDVLKGNHLTFLGKRFDIVWPDGEPPCLEEVLGHLLAVARAGTVRQAEPSSACSCPPGMRGHICGRKSPTEEKKAKPAQQRVYTSPACCVDGVWCGSNKHD